MVLDTGVAKELTEESREDQGAKITLRPKQTLKRCRITPNRQNLSRPYHRGVVVSPWSFRADLLPGEKGFITAAKRRYAGLGATASGTEPADWMRAVLRGRNLPLEQSVGVLAEAMKKEFPRHMIRMPGIGAPIHNVFIAAFIGDETRFYTIDLVFAADRKSYRFKSRRHLVGKSVAAARPPR